MSTVFRVILEGEQEVPPRDSTASGVGTVIFDSAAVAASYSFDIQGLDFGLGYGWPTSDADDPTTMSPARIFTVMRCRRERTHCLRADRRGSGY